MARRKTRSRAGSRDRAVRSASPGPPRRRPLALLLIAVAIGALCAAGWWMLRPRRPPVASSASRPAGPAAPARPIPEVQGLAQVPAAVRALLTQRREAVERSSTSPQAWGRYGMALDAFELYPEALACYEAVLALQPNLFEPTYMRAVMLDFTGAPTDQVVSAFERAVSLQPDYAPAHLRRAMALARLGRFEEATLSYRQALALDPDFTWAHRGLGQALLASGDLTGAVEHLEAAERLSPGDGTAPAALATAYQRLGRLEEAGQAERRARGRPREKAIPDPVRYEVEQTARLAGAGD